MKVKTTNVTERNSHRSKSKGKSKKKENKRKITKHVRRKTDIISIVDYSVKEMSIGERRTVITPYEYVYGDTPGNIPQDSYLIFELILVEVKDK